jgi:hypothetical protein
MSSVVRHPSTRHVVVLAWSCLVLLGCTKPYNSARWPLSREQKPAAWLELDAGSSAGNFYRAPFPSLARMRDDAVDVTHLPNPLGVGFVNESRDIVSRMKGASPYAVVTFGFDGPLPVRPTLPLHTTKVESPIQLIRLGPDDRSHRWPIDIDMTRKADSVRPAHLLQLMPVTGMPLRAGRYAAIVMRDVDGDGVVDAERSAPMEMALQLRAADDTPQMQAWVRALAPLVEASAELQVDLESLAAATVFDVGDETEQVRTWLQDVRTQAVTDVEFDVGAPAPAPAYEHHQEMRGHLRQPLHQPGEPPYLVAGDDGVMVWKDGRPTPTGHADAPFVLTFPKGKMPAEGFPLMLYIHGTGGSPTQATDRGFKPRPGIANVPGVGLSSTAGALGVATACIAGPYSPDRIGWRALDGYGAYAFFHPRAMRDNFAQMLLEQTRFLAWLEQVSVDAARVPGVDASASPDGKVRFDKRKIIVAGHSLGSFLTGMMAGIHSGFAGAVLSGAGGTWIEFAFGPKDPVDLQGLLETISLPPTEDYDRFHPFIMLFQHAVAAADNTLYTSRILRVDSARTPPHVLVMEGEPDAQVPTLLQRALIRSLGVPLVGQDIGKTSLLRVLPGMHAVGLSQVDVAVDNIVVGDLRRTGGVVRYAEDGHLDGHSVIFNRPDARAVFARFVDDIAKGKSPLIQQQPRSHTFVEGESGTDVEDRWRQELP